MPAPSPPPPDLGHGPRGRPLPGRPARRRREVAARRRRPRFARPTHCRGARWALAPARREPNAPPARPHGHDAPSGPAAPRRPRRSRRARGTAHPGPHRVLPRGRAPRGTDRHPDGPARRREGWARSIRSATRTVRCALRNDTVVGVVAMGPPLGPGNEVGTVGELYRIHVLPGLWGQGIGGQLHAAFVRFLREAALPMGRVEAWERNDRARAFSACHGWRPDGHRRPGPAGACYVRMSLDTAFA
ncbi:GNAT family N-acetyltransferase [Streptomyces kronopolitis]|uniref:GNAT family N-acetyltransferase n=1 Tax=Streptomyces kronopolitis TaxID=1612435 RepID=UPI003D99A840